VSRVTLKNNSIGIIPARMNSTRFPGKPMEKILGLPMIGHVYLRTKMSSSLDRVVVATCDREIFNYIRELGGDVVMTSSSHVRASDRCAEALKIIEDEHHENYSYVAMIQGDEPFVNPKDIDEAIKILKSDIAIEVVNLMTNIEDIKEAEDYNNVKVVCDLFSNALYFSRCAIPSKNSEHNLNSWSKQTGLIFFRKSSLLLFNELKQSPLEILEGVDMLRLLENRMRIHMLEINGINIGVDTYDELLNAEKCLSKDGITQYLLKTYVKR